MLWLGTQHPSEGGMGSDQIHPTVSDAFNEAGVGVGVALRSFSSVLRYFLLVHLASTRHGSLCRLVSRFCRRDVRTREYHVAVRRLIV